MTIPENTAQKAILVVEDEPGIADNITFALESEGFFVTHATTASEGITQYQERHFHLILLDVGLPDYSGFEVCKTIRKESQVPLVFLTARSEEIDRILGLELGADDYITKPFSPRELVARIKAILRRSGQDTPTQSVSTPGLSIDHNKREIRYHGTFLPLSFHEFELLSLLASRPGWVYSRERILETIWTDPSMVSTRTVDAHIKALRKKMRTITNEELILTHRSVGYSLKEQ